MTNIFPKQLPQIQRRKSLREFHSAASKKIDWWIFGYARTKYPCTNNALQLVVLSKLVEKHRTERIPRTLLMQYPYTMGKTHTSLSHD